MCKPAGESSYELNDTNSPGIDGPLASDLIIDVD
jgi:hypothetical protein